MFCWLMDRIADRGQHLESGESWSWLHGLLVKLNTDSQLNCILSDGKRLFCYYDQNGHKGLTVRPVYLLDETRTFGDETIELDLADHLSNHGIVVASNPLSSAGWESMKPGELVVYARGEIVFTSHRADKLVRENTASEERRRPEKPARARTR
jgi:predicted glutamine amidotransferase